MNIQAYITSGILELYVHGLASPEEMREVEELASKHPEIQAEIDAIQQALEGYAFAHQVQPPEGLKHKIIERIENSAKPKTKTKPAESKGAEPRIVKMNAGKMNIAAAAAWLLGLSMIGACVAAFLFYRQAEIAKTNLLDAQAQFDQFKKECEDKQKQDEEIKKQFIDIRHWATKPAQMKGTKLAEEAFAIVYWNDLKRTSYLDIVNLPEPPSGKQYQLWAIVGGQPTDMGVFDLAADSAGLKTIPFIENAQAFAVTLEPAGGSQSPTLDQMYVVGNLAKT